MEAGDIPGINGALNNFLNREGWIWNFQPFSILNQWNPLHEGGETVAIEVIRDCEGVEMFC